MNHKTKNRLVSIISASILDNSTLTYFYMLIYKDTRFTEPNHDDTN